jgi:putative PIN family toxin of toxin-antitoxin system
MIRVVFDTNVLYSAILKSASVPAKAVDLVASGLVTPCVSDDVLAEYRRVLFRPELDLHGGRRRRLLEILSTVSLHVVSGDVLKISDHEPDNRFLECANAALATYLVTGNTKHFPKAFKKTMIVTPKQFIDTILTDLAQGPNEKS